jgi:hypothetical protein
MTRRAGSSTAAADQAPVTGLTSAATPAVLSDPTRLVVSVPVVFLLTLYLILTSRWGSYAGIPGAPFYVGDLGVGLAVVQAVIAARAGRISLTALRGAPLSLLLPCTLLAFAGLRLVAGMQISLVALRDFAPYGYAIVALLSFLAPVRPWAGWRPVLYTCFVAHLVWVILPPRLPGFPWGLPVLGNDAVMLLARPDFDTAVMGVGAAFAVWDLIRTPPPRRPALVAGIAAFVAASLLGVLTLGTRAGLLAALLAIGAALATAWPRLRGAAGAGSWHPLSGRRRPIRLVVLGLGLALAAGLLAITPSGSRLVAGLNDASSAAHGTVAVREDVWHKVTDYVLRDPERTAVGVGFGRNFVAESGSSLALEGTEYTNVRSPHNYVLGSLARLGVAGALIVALIIGLGWWLAATCLRDDAEPVTVLAALLALTLPVIAMLGVVLESPFGAIPYFWAIGQLAAARHRQRTQANA